MFNIAFNGIITVNRGDSFSFPLTINFGSTLEPDAYRWSHPAHLHDKIYFAVMEPNQPFETAIIKKVFTREDVDKDDQVIIKFKPKDTECVLPGKYYYQIKLQRFNSKKLEDGTYVYNLDDYDVDTVIDKTQFFILE